MKTSGPMPPLVQMGKQCLLELTAGGAAGHACALAGAQPLLVRGAQNRGPLLIIPMAGPATEAELRCVCGEMQEPLKGGPGPLRWSPFHKHSELLLSSKPPSGPLGHIVIKTKTPLRFQQ